MDGSTLSLPGGTQVQIIQNGSGSTLLSCRHPAGGDADRPPRYKSRLTSGRSLTMAREDVARLRRGVGAWNAWRTQNPARRVDLSGANLSWAKLGGADLRGCRKPAALEHRHRRGRSENPSASRPARLMQRSRENSRPGNDIRGAPESLRSRPQLEKSARGPMGPIPPRASGGIPS
jgi:hypothetical protein